jgi:tetratricopeptide (TPR) repeat protein
MLETIREFAREHLIELGDSRGRYGLQQTIRDFAHEKLIGRDDLAATAARHCEYYFGIAKRAREKLHGTEQAEWTRRIEVELDNLRAAIALALAGGVDPVIAVKLEVALRRFRTLRGYSTEGRNNIRVALALPAMQEPNVARAHALYTGGVLAMNQSDYAESTKMLTEGLEIYRSLGNKRETAASLSTLSTLCVNRDQTAKAREYEEEALTIFRELADRMGEGIGLLNLGGIAVRQSDLAVAEQFFEQSLAIAQSIKHQELERECERNLGDLALRTSDLKTAAQHLARSLKICRDAEDKHGEAIALWSLGRVDAANGELEAARSKFAEALPAFLSFGMNAEALDCLEDCAGLSQRAGRIDEAVHLYAAAATLRGSLGVRSPHGEAQQQRNIEAARAALDRAAFDAAWAAGRASTLEAAIKHAVQSNAPTAVAA